MFSRIWLNFIHLREKENTLNRKSISWCWIEILKANSKCLINNNMRYASEYVSKIPNQCICYMSSVHRNLINEFILMHYKIVIIIWFIVKLHEHKNGNRFGFFSLLCATRPTATQRKGERENRDMNSATYRIMLSRKKNQFVCNSSWGLFRFFLSLSLFSHSLWKIDFYGLMCNKLRCFRGNKEAKAYYSEPVIVCVCVWTFFFFFILILLSSYLTWAC